MITCQEGLSIPLFALGKQAGLGGGADMMNNSHQRSKTLVIPASVQPRAVTAPRDSGFGVGAFTEWQPRDFNCVYWV
jgi:hypothetical protein